MPQTEKHCECGWLGACLNDPEAPVGYDPQSNSFHFVGPDKSQWILYYCPMCGDKYPDSNFQIDVPIAPDGERVRLQNLTDDVSNPETAIEKIGAPDYDGLMKTYWETNDEFAVDETRTPIRNIEYYNLSKWYTVELYFGDDEPEIRIIPKFMNAHQLDQKFDHSQLPNMPIVGDLDADVFGGGD